MVVCKSFQKQLFMSVVRTWA